MLDVLCAALRAILPTLPILLCWHRRSDGIVLPVTSVSATSVLITLHNLIMARFKQTPRYRYRPRARGGARMVAHGRSGFMNPPAHRPSFSNRFTRYVQGTAHYNQLASMRRYFSGYKARPSRTETRRRNLRNVARWRQTTYNNYPRVRARMLGATQSAMRGAFRAAGGAAARVPDDVINKIYDYMR